MFLLLPVPKYAIAAENLQENFSNYFCRIFRAVALQGGNFELQKLNVGVAGFMSGSVESIAERLGGKEYHTFHRGGADRIAK